MSSLSITERNRIKKYVKEYRKYYSATLKTIINNLELAHKEQGFSEAREMRIQAAKQLLAERLIGISQEPPWSGNNTRERMKREFEG